MQKPLIVVAIRRSNLVVVAHATLLLGVTGYVAMFSAWSLAAVLFVCGLSGAVFEWRRRPARRWLRYRLEEGRMQWESSLDGRQFDEVQCRLVRLGPALSGIRIDADTLWLYPDSMAPYDLRALREALAGQLHRSRREAA